MADAIVEYEKATPGELQAAANDGDQEALKALLDRFKDDRDGLISLGWGNLARLVERNVLTSYLPDNAANREAIRAKMAKIRDNLGGPDPTPLERMLVERVALCWLDSHFAELARDCYHSGGKVGSSVRLFEARDRWCNRANDRYLKALRTLAQVRKLKLPDVRVNAVVMAAVGDSARPIEDRMIEAAPKLEKLDY